MFYAGIGSRKVPESIIFTMSILAKHLAKIGYTLRSGAADGSDKAFEYGCDAVQGKKEIWLPKKTNDHKSYNYYPTIQHRQIASSIHPVWDNLSEYVKLLHARNIGQILGQNLKTPVDFVVCWTPDACENHSNRTKETGGTGTAISIASKNDIPVYNLASKANTEILVKKLLALGKKPGIKILNKYKDKPTNKTIYIGRGSPLGNPYPITKELPRLEAIAKYKEYLNNSIINEDYDILNSLREIKPDSELMCFCAPAPCHGEVIKDIWLQLNKSGNFDKGLEEFKKHHLENTFEISPLQDGINHINIYTKSTTQLGRDLSNLADIGFNDTQHGYFKNLEGFWYYVSTGYKYPELKNMSGYEVKKFAKDLPKIYIDNFQQIIINAIKAKIDQNPELKKELVKSSLPFKHYYYYGDISNSKVISPKGNEFIIDFLTKYREQLFLSIKSTP